MIGEFNIGERNLDNPLGGWSPGQIFEKISRIKGRASRVQNLIKKKIKRKYASFLPKSIQVTLYFSFFEQTFLSILRVNALPTVSYLLRFYLIFFKVTISLCLKNTEGLAVCPEINTLTFNVKRNFVPFSPLSVCFPRNKTGRCKKKKVRAPLRHDDKG